jgi:hypothetical protein
VRLFFRVSSTLLLACGTVYVGLCQSAVSATSAIPSLASCSVPAGKEPWSEAHQTPECRTLEGFEPPMAQMVLRVVHSPVLHLHRHSALPPSQTRLLWPAPGTAIWPLNLGRH